MSKLRLSKIKQQFSSISINWPPLTAAIVFWASFWLRAITFRPEGIYINSDSMWGDWAAHLTMVNRMVASNKLILTQSPFVINQTLNYPFIANSISALLVKLGLDVFSSLIMPSLLFCLLGSILLYYLLKLIFRSKTIGVLGTIIFYLNGGLGFLFQPAYLPTQKNTYYPAAHIYVMNVVESSFIPQRAFALGFPLALLSLILIWRQVTAVIQQARTKTRPNLIAAIGVGLLIGLMPLIHAHSFLGLFLILAGWSIGSYWLAPSKHRASILKFWLALLFSTSLVSIPLIRHFFAPNLQHNFWQWSLGWYSWQDGVFWPWFWFINWGPTLIMAGGGYYWLLKNTREQTHNQNLAVWLLPFWLIFIAINLIQFQPNIWDNTKLLVWSSVGLSGLAAYFLVQAWQVQLNRPWKQWLVQLGLGTVFVVAVLSGALDNYHLLQTKKHSYLMYSTEELKLASWVKSSTPADSIWLTSDKHNHWLDNLTGRQALLGYRGWLWTHGYDYQATESDVRQMFQHPFSSQDLFHHYGVDYVVLGPNELHRWQADQSEFNRHFKLIKASPHYQIYSL